jgi:hypothetical protein
VFELTGIVDLSAGAPALLVPVFTSTAHRSNVPHMQSMYRNLKIESFIPFYDSEEYNVIPTTNEQKLFKNVGDDGIIALRKHDRSLLVGEINDIVRYWIQDKEYIQSYALLTKQILRMVEKTIAHQWDSWTSLSKAVFHTSEQQEYWVQSEAALLQTDDAIWSRIAGRVQPQSLAKSIKVDATQPLDIEYVLSALTNSRFYDAPNWLSLWLELRASIPYDARVYYVGQMWLYYQLQDRHNVKKAKPVFCGVIDGITLTNGMPKREVIDDNFPEFLYDLVSDGIVFSEEFKINDKILQRVFVLLRTVFGAKNAGYAFIQLCLIVLSENYFNIDMTKFLVRLLMHDLDIYEKNPGNVVDEHVGISEKNNISEHNRFQILLDKTIEKLGIYDADKEIVEYLRVLRDISRRSKRGFKFIAI